MIAYLCNRCKKPIDLDQKYCVHLEISYGEKAITSNGKYGNGWSADLCQQCWEKIKPLIDGNKYLKGGTDNE